MSVAAPPSSGQAASGATPMPSILPLNRRSLLCHAGTAGAAALLFPAVGAAEGPLLSRPIPATGEPVPIVGMGTWITFNVGEDEAARNARAEVLRAFFS